MQKVYKTSTIEKSKLLYLLAQKNTYKLSI